MIVPTFSPVAQAAQLAMRGRLLQLHGTSFALVGGLSSSAGNGRSPVAAAWEGASSLSLAILILILILSLAV